MSDKTVPKNSFLAIITCINTQTCQFFSMPCWYLWCAILSFSRPVTPALCFCCGKLQPASDNPNRKIPLVILLSATQFLIVVVCVCVVCICLAYRVCLPQDETPVHFGSIWFSLSSNWASRLGRLVGRTVYVYAKQICGLLGNHSFSSQVLLWHTTWCFLFIICKKNRINVKQCCLSS